MACHAYVRPNLRTDDPHTMAQTAHDAAIESMTACHTTDRERERPVARVTVVPAGARRRDRSLTRLQVDRVPVAVVILDLERPRLVELVVDVDDRRDDVRLRAVDVADQRRAVLRERERKRWSTRRPCAARHISHIRVRPRARRCIRRAQIHVGSVGDGELLRCDGRHSRADDGGLSRSREGRQWRRDTRRRHRPRCRRRRSTDTAVPTW